MMGLSIGHIILFAIIVFVIFGTTKLKNFGKDVGGAVKDFKQAVKDDTTLNDPKQSSIVMFEVGFTEILFLGIALDILENKQAYAVVVSFLIVMFIIPPDIFYMAVAGCFNYIYEIGLLLACVLMYYTSDL